jgi:hypothetical protein
LKIFLNLNFLLNFSFKNFLYKFFPQKLYSNFPHDFSTQLSNFVYIFFRYQQNFQHVAFHFLSLSHGTFLLSTGKFFELWKLAKKSEKIFPFKFSFANFVFDFPNFTPILLTFSSRDSHLKKFHNFKLKISHRNAKNANESRLENFSFKFFITRERAKVFPMFNESAPENDWEWKWESAWYISKMWKW